MGVTARKSGQALEAWTAFHASIQQQHGGKSAWLDQQPFQDFVREQPPRELGRLLIHANRRYRALNSCSEPQKLEQSCYSVLISTLLDAKPKVTEKEALAILASAYHSCGHGNDVAPPFEMAVECFEERPFTPEFFDAASSYRETLRHVRAMAAEKTRFRLFCTLWLDPRRSQPECHSRRVQTSFYAMSGERKLAWELMFRSSSVFPGPRIADQRLAELRPRLDAIGARDFVQCLDEWFTFDPEAAPRPELTGTGYFMYRTLIWASLWLKDDSVMRIFDRLRHAKFGKKTGDRGGRLVGVVDWVAAKRGK